MSNSIRIADAALYGPDYPVMVSVTTTSRCNLRCVMCHHGIRNVKKQDFDMELVDRFDHFFDNASLITLTGLGEAFLSDSFWEILKRGRDTNDGTRPHVFSFNTNGTLLTEKYIDAILESRVKRIRVSIDSADPVMKKRIRGTDLSRIVEGTRRLIRTRNERDYKFPLVGIEMTLMKDTAHEVGAMIDLADDVGADFLEVWPLNKMDEDAAGKWEVEKDDWTFNYLDQMVSGLSDDPEHPEERALVQRAATLDLPMIIRLDGTAIGNKLMRRIGEQITATNPPPWKEESIRCELPWRQQRVTYAGDTFNCCWGRHSLGNLNEQSASEIWHGGKQKAMREMLIEGIIPSLCATSPCAFVRGQSEKRTNDITKKHYFNFSPYGNGTGAQGEGWTTGDDWAMKTGAKVAALIFTRSSPIEAGATMTFTLKADPSVILAVSVNGVGRSRVTIEGGQNETIVSLPLHESDFTETGEARVSFEQERAGGSIYFLHSAHVSGVKQKPVSKVTVATDDLEDEKIDALAL